jgi:hypothetical protein
MTTSQNWERSQNVVVIVAAMEGSLRLDRPAATAAECAGTLVGTAPGWTREQPAWWQGGHLAKINSCDMC